MIYDNVAKLKTGGLFFSKVKPTFNKLNTN